MGVPTTQYLALPNRANVCIPITALEANGKHFAWLRRVNHNNCPAARVYTPSAAQYGVMCGISLRARIGDGRRTELKHGTQGETTKKGGVGLG